jgi:hypothetical protein
MENSTSSNNSANNNNNNDNQLNILSPGINLSNEYKCKKLPVKRTHRNNSGKSLILLNYINRNNSS